MGTIIDITQYKLEHALSNEEVDAKIKLRTSSQANLVRHLKNIPYKGVKGPQIKSAEFHFPTEQLKMNVLPQKSMKSIVEAKKPINVKEDKTENIRRHSDMLIFAAVQQANEKMEKVQDISIQTPTAEESVNIQQPAIEDSFQAANDNSETDAIQNNNVINIDEYIARLNNETQLVKSVKEEASLAQQEALTSDENVSKLSVEVGELEKQEADAEKRSSDLDRKVIAAYENRIKVYANARKELENEIKDANERKQANENKIVEFQSKIDDIREHINTVNENIARKQEILAALQQNEFIDDFVELSGMNLEEEKVKSKVA